MVPLRCLRGVVIPLTGGLGRLFVSVQFVCRILASFTLFVDFLAPGWCESVVKSGFARVVQ